MLEQLTDRLSTLCPIWDARIMQFGETRAVVLELYPRIMLTHYAIAGGDWMSMSLMIDGNGDPVADTVTPPVSLGLSARDIDGMVLKVARAAADSYGKTLETPTFGSQAGDDLLKRMQEQAIAALPFSPTSGSRAGRLFWLAGRQGFAGQSDCWAKRRL